MSREIVGVDFDDAIVNENDTLRLHMNETHGWSHTVEDYLVPDEYWGYWERRWPVDEETAVQLFEAYSASDVKRNLPLIEHNVVDKLRLIKQNRDLVIITSRGEGHVDATLATIEAEAPDLFSDIHFVHRWSANTRATKAEICREIGADYLVDDSFDHCALAAKVGVHGLVFGHHGWNSWQPLQPNMVRVPNWDAVVEYFNERDRAQLST